MVYLAISLTPFPTWNHLRSPTRLSFGKFMNARSSAEKNAKSSGVHPGLVKDFVFRYGLLLIFIPHRWGEERPDAFPEKIQLSFRPGQFKKPAESAVFSRSFFREPGFQWTKFQLIRNLLIFSFFFLPAVPFLLRAVFAACRSHRTSSYRMSSWRMSWWYSFSKGLLHAGACQHTLPEMCVFRVSSCFSTI